MRPQNEWMVPMKQRSIWASASRSLVFLLARSFAGRFFQTDLEATANFSSRFPREGHRGEGIDRKMPTGEQVDHPLDHRRGLSRPGSGLDENRCRELRADGIALRLIAEGFCWHYFLPRCFLGRSSRMGTSSGFFSWWIFVLLAIVSAFVSPQAAA